jgi:hypothetical protein
MAVMSRRAGRRDPEADAAASDTGAARAPRTRVAAARGAWAVGSGMVAVARVVRLITWIVVLVIAIAIVLFVTGANPANAVVKAFHDVGSTLVGPFHNLFKIKDAKVSLAVNWGVAAVVYLIVGSLLASLIARMAPRGVHPSRPVT